LLLTFAVAKVVLGGTSVRGSESVALFGSGSTAFARLHLGGLDESERGFLGLLGGGILLDTGLVGDGQLGDDCLHLKHFLKKCNQKEERELFYLIGVPGFDQSLISGLVSLQELLARVRQNDFAFAIQDGGGDETIYCVLLKKVQSKGQKKVNYLWLRSELTRFHPV